MSKIFGNCGYSKSYGITTENRCGHINSLIIIVDIVAVNGILWKR